MRETIPKTITKITHYFRTRTLEPTCTCSLQGNHPLSLNETLTILVYPLGRYVMGQPAFIPATPLGVLEILKRCRVETFGKTACVVGRSKNIGKFNTIQYIQYSTIQYSIV